MFSLKNFFQKLKFQKSIFSLDFFLKYNWVLTVGSFCIILFFSLLVWWKNFIFLSSATPSEILQEENTQDFEAKDRKIKKIMDVLEKKRDQFDNFPKESLPRERVFKSNFVWEEENALVEGSQTKEDDKKNSSEKISF